MCHTRPTVTALVFVSWLWAGNDHRCYGRTDGRPRPHNLLLLPYWFLHRYRYVTGIPVPNYTAWWQRHIGANDSPVVSSLCMHAGCLSISASIPVPRMDFELEACLVSWSCDNSLEHFRCADVPVIENEVNVKSAWELISAVFQLQSLYFSVSIIVSVNNNNATECCYATVSNWESNQPYLLNHESTCTLPLR